MQPLRIWYDPPHVRWGRVAVTVVVVTALVGWWVAQRRGVFEDPASPVAAAPVAVAAASAVLPMPAPATGPGMIASVSAPARAASTAEIVCGLPAVNFDPADEKQIERLTHEAMEKLSVHRQRVLPGWLEEMKSSGDTQLQAAAWYLEALGVWSRRVEAAVQVPESDEALEELARLAQVSRDPLPYALAFQACDIFRGKTIPPGCAALRAEDWAQRDPGNAYPWLLVAGRSGVDARQRSGYIERALDASEVRSTWGAMHELMARAAPRDEAPLDRSVRYFEALSADGVQPTSTMALTVHCRDPELRIGQRRAQCERLAALLVDRSDSLLLHGVGRSIGRSLGWSKDRLDVLDRERDVLLETMPDLIEGGGCGGLARGQRFFADVARYGEIGALRRHQQAAQTAPVTTANR